MTSKDPLLRYSFADDLLADHPTTNKHSYFKVKLN